MDHPAVDAVAVGAITSFGGSASWMRSGDGSKVYIKRVGTGWFSTLGIPLVAGRDFTVAEAADALYRPLRPADLTGAQLFIRSARPASRLPG